MGNFLFRIKNETGKERMKEGGGKDGGIVKERGRYFVTGDEFFRINNGKKKKKKKTHSNFLLEIENYNNIFSSPFYAVQ
jgi:hypothetical protein